MRRSLELSAHALHPLGRGEEMEIELVIDQVCVVNPP